jgi:hypothetical protein
MQWLRITLNLVVLVCLLTCSACGSDNPVKSSPTPLPSELVGTRTLTSWTLNGQVQPLGDVFEEQSSVTGTLTINSNRTYTAKEFDVSGNLTYSDSGSFTVSGNHFTLTTNMVNGSPITPETYGGTWEVSGHELLMTMVNGPNTAVMTFTKAPSGP